MIDIKNLNNRYGTIITAKDVSCCFEDNKVTVILGGSGSGKSTLLKHIVGLEKPNSGSIEFNGKDVTKLNKKETYKMRKQMGMLFQGSALFNSFNIFDNIAFPLRQHRNLSEKAINTLIKMKLEMVGLRGIEHMMPSQLSGGMTKRVGLARAIIMDPQIVFYDEPTSGLDPISAGVINGLILDLNRKLGVTSVVVSHDIDSALLIADKVIILFYGEIIAMGTPEEIRSSTDPKVIQFITGSPDGPIPFSVSKKDFIEDLMDCDATQAKG
jgi:phospholipid/cholesterol/gamma-HCH transport system ATP-binding protein